MNRLRSFWDLLNLPCEGMVRLASESLDRDLPRWERLALKSHLLYCVACRRCVRQIKLLRIALHRLAESVETEDLLPGPGLPKRHARRSRIHSRVNKIR